MHGDNDVENSRGCSHSTGVVCGGQKHGINNIGGSHRCGCWSESSRYHSSSRCCYHGSGSYSYRSSRTTRSSYSSGVDEGSRRTSSYSSRWTSSSYGCRVRGSYISECESSSSDSSDSGTSLGDWNQSIGSFLSLRRLSLHRERKT